MPSSVSTGVASSSVTKVVAPVQDAYTRDGNKANIAVGQANPERLDVKLGVVGVNRFSFLQFDIRGINGFVSDANIFLKVYGARIEPAVH